MRQPETDAERAAREARRAANAATMNDLIRGAKRAGSITFILPDPPGHAELNAHLRRLMGRAGAEEGTRDDSQ
jgi:hypothetical protein